VNSARKEAERTLEECEEAIAVYRRAEMIARNAGNRQAQADARYFRQHEEDLRSQLIGDLGRMAKADLIPVRLSA
jgi:hypothetical protein